ncbi:MAG: LytTR family DNA-binding domain-containing protein [Lachnospiraceae bacterium]|nr:LytTR family DNA-binding domain-containing protein [Lachnospiraceae bacterium]
METLYIGICDDEDFWREHTKLSCTQAGFLSASVTYIVFSSAEEVLSYKGPAIDLLFLDIEMSGLSGIELMEQSHNTMLIRNIVFLSSHPEHVFHCFSKKTLGFEQKPLACDHALGYLQKVYESKYQNIIIFDAMNADTIVPLRDFFYLEGKSGYVEAVTATKRITLTGTLKFWEEKLSYIPVLRIHKSYLVNMHQIYSLKKELHFHNLEEVLPVGRVYRKQAAMLFSNFLLEQATTP